MQGLIHQLPDHIANQIAAGEVIQRPGSAVKELLENAVDCGATIIRLTVRDAGKSLVQVTDNGNGMSAVDARMCIARHATSKISSIEDIFQIRTMGFRGEALASIAAVATLEVKTRQPDAEMGTCIIAEHSQIVEETPCACAPGTCVSMKNLFFNVPARRNFLKGNPVELKNIIEEFTRVALGFPDIFFSMDHNGHELFHLEKGNLKQRVLQVLGSQFNSKLVPVNEQTEYLNIQGWVGKPDTARRTRGAQYFFVNKRFIRSPYLHRALMNAFEGMIQPQSYPMYLLYLELDPAHIDINVHPAKQEIKFEDERMVFAFMHAAVRHALGQFSITPSLDFNLDPEIQQLPAVSQPVSSGDREAAATGSIYKEFSQKHRAHFIEKGGNLREWKSLYEAPGYSNDTEPPGPLTLQETSFGEHAILGKEPYQIHQRYILSQIHSGFILIDQRAARERILFEKYQESFKDTPSPSQKTLFPRTLHFSVGEAALLLDILPDLGHLGYLLEPFGHTDFLLEGIPADLSEDRAQPDIEQLLEQLGNFSPDLKLERREKLLRAVARLQAGSAVTLSILEMQHLIDSLFGCRMPGITPDGNPTYISFSIEGLEKKFGAFAT